MGLEIQRDIDIDLDTFFVAFEFTPSPRHFKQV